MLHANTRSSHLSNQNKDERFELKLEHILGAKNRERDFFHFFF